MGKSRRQSTLSMNKRQLLRTHHAWGGPRRSLSRTRTSERHGLAYRVSRSVSRSLRRTCLTCKNTSSGRAKSSGSSRPYGGRATCTSYTMKHLKPRWKRSVPWNALYASYSRSHFSRGRSTRYRSLTSCHNHLGGYRCRSRYRKSFRRNHR